MAISFSLIGPGIAAEAAALVDSAWDPPVISYTPAYLDWQLRFPSPIEMPAAAAFDGATLVGFAAATGRRLQHRQTSIDAAVVSFVAVHSGWRGQGIAGGVYRTLLRALVERQAPVVTYGVEASAGERAILRAYPEAGFELRPLGVYSNYAFVSRLPAKDGPWRAAFSDDVARISSIVSAPSQDELTLWSMPDARQAAHYFADPRPRKFIAVEHGSMGVHTAGFVMQSALRTARGIEYVTTLDSVWTLDANVDGLLALLGLASTACPLSPPASVVTCPNLARFDEQALRLAGIRRTGARYNGYFCFPRGQRTPSFERTNLEIV